MSAASDLRWLAEIICSRGPQAAQFDHGCPRRAVAEYLGGEGATLEHDGGSEWTLYPGDPDREPVEYVIRGAEAW